MKSPSVRGNSAERQLIAEFANLVRRQVSLNSKPPLIVKLCFRYVHFFVTLISGRLGQKGLETVSQRRHSFVLKSYLHI